MLVRRAKDPVRAQHHRKFGRLWCRYICGTCDARSRWHNPYRALEWFMGHSDECWEPRIINDEDYGDMDSCAEHAGYDDWRVLQAEAEAIVRPADRSE